MQGCTDGADEHGMPIRCRPAAVWNDPKPPKSISSSSEPTTNFANEENNYNQTVYEDVSGNVGDQMDTSLPTFTNVTAPVIDTVLTPLVWTPGLFETHMTAPCNGKHSNKRSNNSNRSVEMYVSSDVSRASVSADAKHRASYVATSEGHCVHYVTDSPVTMISSIDWQGPQQPDEECSSNAHESLVSKCQFCHSLYETEQARDEHQRECILAPYCSTCDMWFSCVRTLEMHERAMHRL